MKTILKLTICTLFFASSMKAQIPNSGFELLDSTNTNTLNWRYTGVISITIGDSIITDGFLNGVTTQAHIGNYALELRNSYNVTQNQPFMYGAVSATIPDSLLYIGFTPRFPISSKPYSLEFYYRVTQNPYMDSTTCSVKIYNSNDEIIGKGITSFWDVDANYKMKSVPIQYFTSSPEYLNDSIPVKASIDIANIPNMVSSGIGQRVQVDDIRFNYIPLGIDEIKEDNEISIHPNPSHSTITVSCSTSKLNNSALCIYNSIGQMVYHTKITQERTILNVSSLANGFYVLKAGQSVMQFVKE